MPAVDGRFSDPDWHDLPFALAAQAFLLSDRWWRAATTELRGVTAQHERQIAFIARQWLDVFSPANSSGMNLARGFGQWLDDVGAL